MRDKKERAKGSAEVGGGGSDKGIEREQQRRRIVWRSQVASALGLGFLCGIWCSKTDANLDLGWLLA